MKASNGTDKQRQPRLLTFIEKYELTPGNILLVFFSFWTTALAVRGIIFYLVYHGSIPQIFVSGYHIHHFTTGFFLLIAGIILFSRKIFTRYVPLILIGSALALIFDEFLYWTRGHFTYWSAVNLIATILIGSVILIIYLYTKHNFVGHLSKKRVLLTFSLIIIFSSCLYLLFDHQNMLSATYQRAAAAPLPHRGFFWPNR